MAHFAKIENGIVTQVIVVGDEHEHHGQEFLNSIGLDGTWIQTSYNHNFRGNFAGIGFTYDSKKDLFIPPKPYASWRYEESSNSWIAPTSYPTTGGDHTWNESTRTWVAVSA
jgi:hypothetical protein